jgi:hypothetical protein
MMLDEIKALPVGDCGKGLSARFADPCAGAGYLVGFICKPRGYLSYEGESNGYDAPAIVRG